MRDKWTWREDLTPSIPNQKLYEYVLETIEKHNLTPNQPMKLTHTKSGLYKVKLTHEEVKKLQNVLNRESANDELRQEPEPAPKLKKRVFKQYVSMKATQSQYESDLSGPLTRFGYKFYDTPRFSDYRVVATGFDLVTFPVIGSSHQNLTYYIDHYNPELFLAIAAMSEGEEFYPGEWVTTKDPKKSMEFTGMRKGDKIRKIYSISGNKIYFREGNFLGEVTNTELKEFARKATLEELVEHLATQKVDNSKPNKMEEKDLLWGEAINLANKILEISRK